VPRGLPCSPTEEDIDVSEFEAKKAEVKKLSAKAMQLKMDLHDLSEELPLNWELIPVVAKKAHEAFAELEQKRSELKALESST
jgi:hypothetical protein